jgi:hypothetical protein
MHSRFFFDVKVSHQESIPDNYVALEDGLADGAIVSKIRGTKRTKKEVFRRTHLGSTHIIMHPIRKAYE